MRRLLKAPAILLLATALLAAYLVRFHGLRVERDGSGLRPLVSFYKPESHMVAIEQQRSEAAVEPATPPSAPVEKPPVAPPYWTDFRGPHRDGRYDQGPVR